MNPEIALKQYADAQARVVMLAQQNAEARYVRDVAAARYMYATCAGLNPPRPIHHHVLLEDLGLGPIAVPRVGIDPDGSLLIPVFAGRMFAGVQRVTSDGEVWHLPPDFVPDAIFDFQRQGTSCTVVCHGFRSGVVAFVAVPDARVVVAFDSTWVERLAKRERGMVTWTTADLAAQFKTRRAERRQAVASTYRSREQNDNAAKRAALSWVKTTLMHTARFNGETSGHQA